MTDLLEKDGKLDEFLRKRFQDIKDIQEEEEDQITSLKNIHSIEHNDSNGDTSQHSSRRRQALQLSERKGAMISKQSTDAFDGYAVKLVRNDINSELKKQIAVADMAAEARILSTLSHPNIMRIRGIMGDSEGPGNYGIIMDKLRSTLTDQIQEWSRNNCEEGVPRSAPDQHFLLQHAPEWLPLLKSQKEKQKQLFRQTEFYVERVEAVHEISKAFVYIHGKKIIYRDLKPENVGLTNENYVLFDFGLARELLDANRVSDKPEDADRYLATALTGSRLFMAPEVATRKPYGFSADVYSFAILFWEVFALTEVFPGLTLNKHFKMVILKGKRPPSLEDILPEALNKMLENCWDKDPLRRPTFKTICTTLAKEIVRIEDSEMFRVLSEREMTSEESGDPAGGPNNFVKYGTSNPMKKLEKNFKKLEEAFEKVLR